MENGCSGCLAEAKDREGWDLATGCSGAQSERSERSSGIKGSALVGLRGRFRVCRVEVRLVVRCEVLLEMEGALGDGKRVFDSGETGSTGSGVQGSGGCCFCGGCGEEGGSVVRSITFGALLILGRFGEDAVGGGRGDEERSRKRCACFLFAWLFGFDCAGVVGEIKVLARVLSLVVLFAGVWIVLGSEGMVGGVGGIGCAGRWACALDVHRLSLCDRRFETGGRSAGLGFCLLVWLMRKRSITFSFSFSLTKVGTSAFTTGKGG